MLRNFVYSIILSAALFLVSTEAYADVKGHVRDSKGEPVAGVMVYEKGQAGGAMTDIDGSYSVAVTSLKATITFSAIGYKDVSEAVAGRTTVDVVMEEDNLTLDEVVVVGYGVQKKGTLTGSVSSITTDKLTSAPTDNITNMLGGKLPGLVSRQTTGLPGENESQIYIRGISTTGSSTPLVLVDGVERSYSNLDPSEIANITILKDAASAAVYGVKGANGVILVTTKRGDVKKTSVTYNGAVTLSQNSDMLTLLDGPEYAYWHNKASDLDGVARDYDEKQIGYIKNGGDPQGLFVNTDYLGLIFKKVAVGHNHNISVSGGNDNVRYFVGGSFLNQDGIISNVNFNRYNLRSNIDINITKRLTLKLDVSGRIEKRHQPGVSAGSSDPTASYDNGGAEYGYKNIVFYAITARPTTSPRLPDGTYVGYNNPLIARDQSGFNDKNSSFVQSTISLDYRIPGVEGLTAKGMFSYDFSNSLQKYLTLPYNQATPTYGKTDSNGFVEMTYGPSPHIATGVNNLKEYHNLFTRYTYSVQLNYANTFASKHEVGADVVWEQSGTSSRTLTASKQNFAITEIPDLDFSTEVTPNSVSGYHSNSVRHGLLVRASYSYDSRYLFQASVRVDGSAKFAKEKRYGVFPAVSAGWRISEEPFMSQTRSVLDNLKLRASYGILGNDSISDFLYVQGMALSSNPVAVINGTPVQSLSTSSIPNKDITWETTTTYNAGLDLSVFHGMLTFEGDVFYKVTNNILQSVSGQQPPSLGGNYPNIVNNGVVDVRGFELVLGHSNRVGDFNYAVSANVSYAKNRYVKTTDSDNIPVYQSKLGQSVGSVLGYVSDGLFQTEEQLASLPKYGDSKLGDIILKDLNGDGRITAEDRTWIASPQIPTTMFGLNISMGWKGLDLSLFFQGAAGTEIMLCGNYTALGFSNGTYYTQAFKWGSNPPKYLVEGSWTPDHTDAAYPRLTLNPSTVNTIPSDFWKRDASYLRLKSLQLSYTIPSSLTRKFFVENLRLSFNASNLFTFSALSKMGIDPEAPSVNNGYYPQQRVYGFSLGLTF